jgi:hypothetical protein
LSMDYQSIAAPKIVEFMHTIEAPR